MSLELAVLERASDLWQHAKQRALKRKTLPYAEASALLAGTSIDEIRAFTWPLHVWCWLRGLPPLNVVVVPRGKTPLQDGGFAVTDFDSLYESLGASVYTLEYAWHYPWAKVPDPTPEQLQWALTIHREHYFEVQRFRFLDIELELRERDEAKGRRRPLPGTYESWPAVQEALHHVLATMEPLGIRSADLRPPGKGPYPPPRPIIGNWAD